LGFLLFSGFAGSAVGTIFFTLALKHGNSPVVNVVLNIQPVISTAPFSSSAIASRLIKWKWKIKPVAVVDLARRFVV